MKLPVITNYSYLRKCVEILGIAQHKNREFLHNESLTFFCCTVRTTCLRTAACNYPSQTIVAGPFAKSYDRNSGNYLTSWCKTSRVMF